MPDAFVIMQFANDELENVWRNVYIPAIKNCGLEPKRVDLDDKGDLLVSEIKSFIEDAQIIIADLTNQRPNCYLEVGYALGYGKKLHLVLTAREDHSHDSPRHSKTGPKVHFDATGYGILFWDLSDLATFKKALETKIRQRQRYISKTSAVSPFETTWFQNIRSQPMHDLRHRVNRRGSFEFQAALINTDLSLTWEQIVQASRSVQLRHHWPVFLVDPGQQPVAKENGIVSSIQLDSRRIYQHWGISTVGDLYFFETFQEADPLPGLQGIPGVGPVTLGSDKDRLNYDLRFRRLAETLIFCHRFYTAGLKLDQKLLLHIRVRYGGLTQCELSASDYITWGRRLHHRPGDATENETRKEKTVYLGALLKELPQLVEFFGKDVLTFFNFSSVESSVYQDIVNDLIAREVYNLSASDSIY